MKFEKNTELDQANLRIIIASIALVYMAVLGFLPGQRFDTYLPVVTYISLFLLASVVLRQAIVRWPGHYPARRIFGMLHDYTGTSFGLVVGGEEGHRRGDARRRSDERRYLGHVARHDQGGRRIRGDLADGELSTAECKAVLDDLREGGRAVGVVSHVAELRRFLADYRGTVVAVTHDRYFLDNVAQWILELDRGKAHPYEGNYSTYLETKQERLKIEGAKDAKRAHILVATPGRLLDLAGQRLTGVARAELDTVLVQVLHDLSLQDDDHLVLVGMLVERVRRARRQRHVHHDEGRAGVRGDPGERVAVGEGAGRRRGRGPVRRRVVRGRLAMAFLSQNARNPLSAATGKGKD